MLAQPYSFLIPIVAWLALDSSTPISAPAERHVPAAQVAALTAPAGLVLHVEAISVGWTYAGGVKKRPNVRVRVLDQYGVPVNGATVTGDWSGCFNLRGQSGTTGDLDLNRDGVITGDETGWAEITSTRTASCPNNQCLFTFTVTSVAQAGNTYDPLQNVETSDFSRCNPFLP